MIDLSYEHLNYSTYTGGSRRPLVTPMSPMNKPQHMKDVDRVLKILASVQRRRLLRHLVDKTDQSADRQELARFLAETSSEVESTEIQLIHNHLPRLKEADLIDYDRRSGALRPTRRIEDIERLMDACEELEEAWS